MDFTHLHVHGEQGSLLDGAIRVKDVAKRAYDLGMSSIAISDHGSLAGLLNHYKECKKYGVKPIFAIETYLTEDKDGLPNEEKTRDNYHMILIAKNFKGWQNLMYLNSNAHQNNFYYKPRISIHTLADYSEGLIGTSACLSSICRHKATHDEVNERYWDPEHTVQKIVTRFKEIFRGEYYLELMDNSLPEQKMYNDFLLDLSVKTSTELIITADAHYLSCEDEKIHTFLMAMQSKQTIEEYSKQQYFHYENCYIRSPEEMLASAKKLKSEAAFHNTLKIAEQCNVDLDMKYKLPIFDITTDNEYSFYK
jgi:DNA polymerase III subunit alpha